MKTVVHPRWSSYIPILLKTMAASDGPVLELGVGTVSTPLLHWLCKTSGRKLVSYDSDEYYFKDNKYFAEDTHKLIFVKDNDWKSIDIEKTHWGLVFIDHGPSLSRAITAIKVANCADYVLLHDANPGFSRDYQYKRVYPHFKYIYKYKKSYPHTAVLSNFKDLTNIML